MSTDKIFQALQKKAIKEHEKALNVVFKSFSDNRGRVNNYSFNNPASVEVLIENEQVMVPVGKFLDALKEKTLNQRKETITANAVSTFLNQHHHFSRQLDELQEYLER